MSLTPGWELANEELIRARRGGFQHLNDFVFSFGDFHYIDNGSEFKKFPRTKEGWEDLCDALKEFEP